MFCRRQLAERRPWTALVADNSAPRPPWTPLSPTIQLPGRRGTLCRRQFSSQAAVDPLSPTNSAPRPPWAHLSPTIPLTGRLECDFVGLGRSQARRRGILLATGRTEAGRRGLFALDLSYFMLIAHGSSAYSKIGGSDEESFPTRCRPEISAWLDASRRGLGSTFRRVERHRWRRAAVAERPEEVVATQHDRRRVATALMIDPSGGESHLVHGFAFKGPGNLRDVGSEKYSSSLARGQRGRAPARGSSPPGHGKAGMRHSRLSGYGDRPLSPTL